MILHENLYELDTKYRQVSKEDQGVVGTVYADAIEDIEEAEDLKDKLTNVNLVSLRDENPKNPKMVPGAKKMYLDENLFKDLNENNWKKKVDAKVAYKFRQAMYNDDAEDYEQEAIEATKELLDAIEEVDPDFTQTKLMLLDDLETLDIDDYDFEDEFNYIVEDIYDYCDDHNIWIDPTMSYDDLEEDLKLDEKVDRLDKLYDALTHAGYLVNADKVGLRIGKHLPKGRVQGGRTDKYSFVSKEEDLIPAQKIADKLGFETYIKSFLGAPSLYVDLRRDRDYRDEYIMEKMINRIKEKTSTNDSALCGLKKKVLPKAKEFLDEEKLVNKSVSGNDMIFDVKDDGSVIVYDGAIKTMEFKVVDKENFINQLKDSNFILKENLETEEDETIPDSVTPGTDAGIAAILTKLIREEWDAIQDYNDAIVSAEVEGYHDIAEVLKDIVNEENLHVGQLEQCMKKLAPNTESIEIGEEEAIEQLTESSEHKKQYTIFAKRLDDSETFNTYAVILKALSEKEAEQIFKAFTKDQPIELLSINLTTREDIRKGIPQVSDFEDIE